MSIRRTFLAAAAAAGLLVTAVAPAGAHLVRPVSSFVAGGITDPLDVAVEQSTGDVFVTGLASGNVEKYSPSGTPEPSFVSPKLVEPWGVAVDNSTDTSKGDVYVADAGASVVYKLDPSGQPVAGFTTIEAVSIPSGDPGSENFSPHGVAVDPTNGNVVVEDEANAETDIFNSSGVFVSQFAGGAVGVAVGSGNDIFTSGGEGVQRWSAADGYTSHTTIDPTGDFAVAVNLSSGDVLSDDGSSIAEYEASDDPLLQFGSGQLDFSAGVTVDEATNTVYATDVFSGNVYIFGAPFRLPDVITSASSTNPTATTATLSGTVNPDTTSVTGCRFEYGTTTSYGASLGCSQVLPLTGTTPLPASLSLSGLQANETYHYRLDASNSKGTSFGGDQIFTTSPAPPTLDEQSASGLTQTSAILNASINPNNEPTTYHFEYGTNIEYGTGVPIPEQTVGAGSGVVVVGQPLAGLQPGTTYHFRVIAINATGVSTGEDRTFRTSALLPRSLKHRPWSTSHRTRSRSRERSTRAAWRRPTSSTSARTPPTAVASWRGRVKLGISNIHSDTARPGGRHHLPLPDPRDQYIRHHLRRGQHIYDTGISNHDTHRAGNSHTHTHTALPTPSHKHQTTKHQTRHHQEEARQTQTQGEEGHQEIHQEQCQQEEAGVMSVGRKITIALTTLGLITTGSTLMSTTALAAPQYPFLREIASPPESSLEALGFDEESGQLLVVGNEFVRQVSSTDVNIYDIADDRFVDSLTETPAGEPLEGGTVVAAYDANGDVYVANPVLNETKFTGTVSIFNAVGEGIGQLTGFKFEGDILAITVDQETGDVYVLEGVFEGGQIRYLNSEGKFQTQFPIRSALPGENDGELASIALDDTTHQLLVTDRGDGVVYVFTQTGAYVTTWTGADTPQGSFGTANGIATDGANGDVFLAGGKYVYQLDSAGKYVGEITTGPRGALEDEKVAVNSATGEVYAGNCYDRECAVYIFAPLAFGPVLSTGGSSNMQAHSVTLTGMVAPEGLGAQGVDFEYGTTESYGSSIEASPSTCAAAASSCAAQASLTGLTPNTVYHYRLTGTDSEGTTHGFDRVFKTQPALPDVDEQPGSVTGVTQFEATLHGTINPGNAPTSYRFVYGPTEAYGSEAPVPDNFTVANDSNDSVSQVVTGLRPGTTYHFAVRATNGAGSVAGPDLTFTTSAVPAPSVGTGLASDVGWCCDGVWCGRSAWVGYDVLFSVRDEHWLWFELADGPGRYGCA